MVKAVIKAQFLDSAGTMKHMSLPAPYAALEFARLARVRSISGWAARWVRTLLLLPSWALGTETRR